MGQITAFNINTLIELYKPTIYIETGTGIGESLKHASQFLFKKLYTIDIDSELSESAKSKNTDNRIEFVNKLSTDALKLIVPTLDSEESVLFFLDAHLPGADFHKITYIESMHTYKKDCFPLEEELQIIKEYRTNKKDIIIIDDLQFYEPEQCQHKTWHYGSIQEQLGLKQNSLFIYDMFTKTHDITIHTEHQGYLLLVPK